MSIIFRWVATAGSITGASLSICYAQSVSALLRDLPGWTSEAVKAKNLDIPQTVNGAAQSLQTTTRRYICGSQTLDVRFFRGRGADIPSVPKEQAVETADGGLTINKINGFTTMLTTHKPGQDQAVQASFVVWLEATPQKAGVLTFTARNMTGGEVVDMARSFDWRAFATSVKAN